jgi:hypothetical protein
VPLVTTKQADVDLLCDQWNAGYGWSRAVDPTQAKKRLEWDRGPRPDVVDPVLLARVLFNPFSKLPYIGNSVITTRQLSTLYQQQMLGAPFKPFFGLSGIAALDQMW